MILGLVSCFTTILGQPSKSLIIPSIELERANHEVLTSKPALKEKPIDNKNPYKDRVPEVGGLIYLVIFEPIQNVEFSRSVHKITSIVDFSPYVEYFQKYEQYITKLYRDLRKEENVKLSLIHLGFWKKGIILPIFLFNWKMLIVTGLRFVKKIPIRIVTTGMCPFA